jgi:hypothetical protein
MVLYYLFFLIMTMYIFYVKETNLAFTTARVDLYHLKMIYITHIGSLYVKLMIFSFNLILSLNGLYSFYSHTT